VLILSAIFGLISSVLGLIMAIIWDSPPGPVMVLVATSLYIFSAVFASKKGLLNSYLRRIELNRRIYKEDIIKYVFRSADSQPNVSNISDALDLSEGKTTRFLRSLKHRGVVSQLSPFVKLSTTGEVMALKLIRAHRLWETYLVDKLNLSPDQIHEEAENYEHFLSDELLDEVDELLGSPESDPHGSPIPPKNE
jgi:Mn-dependent DtxR family transcriptional regulator